MMPLALANSGEENIIRRVGGNVTVISVNDGNLIVNVKESRIAVSREMANKIFI